MSNSKGKSIQSQIVELLYSKGSMMVKQMCLTIPYHYKSVYTKALELKQLGLADKDDNGVWSLREGVTPQTLVTGELEETTGIGAAPGGKAPSPKALPITRSQGVPLDQRGMFIQHMQQMGVSPKEAIPTIADIFFSGDIDSLRWLNQVLSKDAAGFVTPHQRRLMMSWWANTRRLEFDEEEYGFIEPGEGKGKKVAGKPGEVPKKPLDTGQGWRVGKDKVGDWVPLPGGPMNYQEASDAAERRALIASYGAAAPEGEGAEGAGEGELALARKGARRSETPMDYMMKKVIDSFVDGSKGGGEGESETVKRLQVRIDDMERDRVDERFKRLEGIVAQVSSRDPWDEYDKIEQMKQRLGVGSPGVTDQSPAVQLIKDSTDKLDRNVSRLMGIIERTALRSEEFKPEETRNPDERETKAGELLSVAQGKERARGLRKTTFGV